MDEKQRDFKRTTKEARKTWEFQCIDVSNSGIPKIIALFYVNASVNGVDVYTAITRYSARQLMT